MLAALIEIGEYDRRVRVHLSQRHEQTGEGLVTVGWPMKGSDRNDQKITGADRADKTGGGRAQKQAIVWGRSNLSAIKSERVDNRHVVATLSKHGSDLHRPQIREVRIVDEVTRDLYRRKDHRNTRHGRSVVASAAKPFTVIAREFVDSGRHVLLANSSGMGRP